MVIHNSFLALLSKLRKKYLLPIENTWCSAVSFLGICSEVTFFLGHNKTFILCYWRGYPKHCSGIPGRGPICQPDLFQCESQRMQYWEFFGLFGGAQ